MNSLICNQLLLGSTTLWSVDFSLDLKIEVIYRFFFVFLSLILLQSL